MTSPEARAAETAASFEERLDILSAELELAVKWQRPCILLVVYSSEYVRADVEGALENCLIDLGQKSVHLSVRDRDPQDVVPFFQEFKDPAHAIFVIDGFRWGKGDEASVYSTISLQWEYFVERQIRAVLWLTQNEIVKLAHSAPEFWANRHRVIEFVESPKGEQVLRQALDSAWQGTGEYAAEIGDTDAKISLRESLLTELPKGEEAISIRGNLLLTLGVLNWRKGDFEAADDQLQEALKIATKTRDNWFEAECFNAVALIKSSTERTDEAIEAYKQAIQLAPDQIFVWNNLGNLCAKVGRNDEAIFAFRKALEGNPRDPIAWNGLANVHFKLNYVDDAIAAYRKAIQYTPSLAQPWCGLGDVYASIGRADEALKCYHKAIELNKQYVAPWLRLGVLYGTQERYREAVKAYQRALDLDPKNSEVWNQLGTMQMKCEAFDEAVTALLKAIDLDRGNGWAYCNLAFAKIQQGRHKESVSLLLRSVDLFERDADKAVAWNRLASVYRLLNDYGNAVAAYQMADQLGSGLPAPLHPEGVDEQGTSADVAAEEKAAEAKPKAPAIPTPATQSAQPEGEAAGKVTAAAEASPNGKRERSTMAEAPAWIFGEPRAKPNQRAARAAAIPTEKSESATEQSVTTGVAKAPAAPGLGVTASDKPSDATAAAEAREWTRKGNLSFAQGGLDEAVAAFNNAIQLDPAYGVPYSNLALTYVTQGQFPEAILLYQKGADLLESDRDKALAWNGLGNAYRCVGDYANAVTAYQRAAELDPETSGIRDRADNFETGTAPKDAQAWNNLGELLLKTGSLDKAEEAFRKAIELDAAGGRAYSGLARTLAGQAKYEEAVPLFEKSIELLQDDKEKADAWNGLGNAYRKLNDYESAIRAYQKAVVLADEGVDLLTRTRFSLLSNCYTNQ